MLTVAHLCAPPSRRPLQAAPEKSERKALAIPSIVEKVKAAAPQKLDYGLDYYREFRSHSLTCNQSCNGCLVWPADGSA